MLIEQGTGVGEQAVTLFSALRNLAREIDVQFLTDLIDQIDGAILKAELQWGTRSSVQEDSPSQYASSGDPLNGPPRWLRRGSGGESV